MENHSNPSCNFIGYVYKATCLITNKCYIGITTHTLEYRKNQHKNKAKREGDLGVHFHRALNKYGFENFSWECIDVVSTTSKESLISCLKTLEIKYVKLYNSYYEGYNSTKGGDTITILEKKVKIFNESGEFIELLDSRTEVSKKYGISEDCVSAVCNRKLLFSYINGKRYIFRNEFDSYTEEDIIKVKKQKGNPYCKVLAFDKTTNEIIKNFNSIKEGADYFKVKPSTISEIVNNYGCRQSSGKFNGHKIGWRKLS